MYKLANKTLKIPEQIVSIYRQRYQLKKKAKNGDSEAQFILGTMYDNGNIDIIKILIKAGANVNTKDNNGWTALMWANNSYTPNEINDILIEAGAEVYIQ